MDRVSSLLAFSEEDRLQRAVRHQGPTGAAGGTGDQLAALPARAAALRVLLREGGRGAFLPTAPAGGIRRRRGAVKQGIAEGLLSESRARELLGGARNVLGYVGDEAASLRGDA